jgi:peptidoglycan hydrolase-like protein with peptidoglycan-binding domain
MPNSLIWLPSVLQSAGLKVALVPGWEDRGRGDVHTILGVLCHHTAGQRNGNMPSLRVLIDGRSDLQGPLSQLGLGRDGTFYVIAAGRCNHAGAGIWNNAVNGNSNFIGIEGENTGGSNDFPWPAVQMDAYRRGVAAILKHVGQPARACAGHREYARPIGRKSDPVFSMDDFRSAVSAILAGTAPAPVLIPSAEPPKQPGAPVGRPTIRRGATGDLTAKLQRKLGVEANGIFGPKTEAAVRDFQRARGMVPDGIVGPKTWAALDRLP